MHSLPLTDDQSVKTEINIYTPGSARRAETLVQSATGIKFDSLEYLMVALTRGEYFYLSPIRLTF